MNLSPSNDPWINGLLRGAILGVIAAGGALAVALGTDAGTRELVGTALGAFFGALALRTGEAALVDQSNTTQRIADREKS